MDAYRPCGGEHDGPWRLASRALTGLAAYAGSRLECPWSRFPALPGQLANAMRTALAQNGTGPGYRRIPAAASSAPPNASPPCSLAGNPLAPHTWLPDLAEPRDHPAP
jgi:hypothetical protein